MAKPCDLDLPFRSRVWANLLQALGTTTLSVVTFSLFIPMAFVIGRAIYDARQPQKSGVSVTVAIEDSLFGAPSLISAGITLGSWALLFGWGVVRTIKKDKQCLLDVIADNESKVADTLTEKAAEVASLKAQLGESQVSCKVEAVYISELREYQGAQGPTMTSPGWKMNYKPIPGYSRVIVDLWFFNSGGIPTNIWGFKLSINVINTGVGFSGVFLKDQRDDWYMRRPEQLTQNQIEPEMEYSKLSVDWEIDNDDLLKRGNPKQCWVHFAVKSLLARGYENVSCVLEFRDGIREYKHPFTEKVILATIEHRR